MQTASAILRDIAKLSKGVDTLSATARDVIGATQSVLDVRSGIRNLRTGGAPAAPEPDDQESNNAGAQPSSGAASGGADAPPPSAYASARVAVLVLAILTCVGFLVPGVLRLSSTPASAKREVAAASVCVAVGALLVVVAVWYGVSARL